MDETINQGLVSMTYIVVSGMLNSNYHHPYCSLLKCDWVRLWSTSNSITIKLKFELNTIYEPQHNKINILMTCALSEDSDQPGHSPSLIRESQFSAWRSVGSLATHKDDKGAHWRFLSNWLDAQADLILRWVYRDCSVAFAMHRFINIIGAASWQNQQNGMCASEDSDQPGQLPSLIRVFPVSSVCS